MRIKQFTIKNFKSIPPTGITIDFREHLIVLVGKNNAGKSNIFEAIGLLFGDKNPRYLRLGEEYFNDLSEPLVIEAELDGLTWVDGKRLGLSNQQCGNLMHEGRKVETYPGHVTLRLTVPPPNKAEEFSMPSDEGELEEGDNKQKFEVFLANRHEIRRNEAFRKALVKHLIVPPIRSQDDILSPSVWTSYGRLLRDILVESEQAEELAKLIKQATEQLRIILQNEADLLTRTAKITAYVDKISFRLTREGNPIELLRNLSLAVTYGNRTEDVANVGTGTQSAVIIGVLELCLRHLNAGGIRLFSVEEPELFLHPHAQRYVASLLKVIAAEQNNQVILTTHSPAVLADTNILNVVRVDRDEQGGTRCLKLANDYPGLEVSQRILTPETCEMFFADRVILVEGPSESILIPRIARLLFREDESHNSSLDRYNISVINVGGKDRFITYSRFLDDLLIEWRIIADLDALFNDTLALYRQRAGITGSETQDEQIQKLQKVGVLILKQGEIEDYYPREALASLGGCSIEEVTYNIDKYREVWDEPGVLSILEAIMNEHRDELCRVKDSQLPKAIKRCYDQTLQMIRTSHGTIKHHRKTGEAVSAWLKLPKPTIALRVANWMEEHVDNIPQELRELVFWIIEGI